MEAVVQRAVVLANTVGVQYSARKRKLSESAIPMAEQRNIITSLLCHAAKVQSTLTQWIRGIERLCRWARAKSICPLTLSPEELAYYLRDESRGKYSVPATLTASLTWLDKALHIKGWDLNDNSVKAVSGTSKATARRLRTQAVPYTVEVVSDLLRVLFSIDVGSSPAMAYAICFLLTLAFGCLRFSDLDRSHKVTLGKDALHSVTWRSKSHVGESPWAALRRTWKQEDWGKIFYNLAQSYLPEKVDHTPRDSMWPAVQSTSTGFYFVQPVRHGSYSNALRTMCKIHADIGHTEHFTLHSPRFFICGIAGQAGQSLEQRRALGRWGPSSGMPIQYDQARCCAELAAKDQLWSMLQAGWKPGNDYELPCRAPLQPTTDTVVDSLQLNLSKQGRVTGSDTASGKIKLLHNVSS